MKDSDIAIKVENIGKRYRIGVEDEAQETFGGALVNLLKSPIKNYRQYRSLYKFDDTDGGEKDGVFWALKDVSFEVRRGEVLGLIGANGAGKSTLLKVLSRITAPTRGRAEIHGRVSSLLEVGTGFHQELTGRENIYLNGTVLGMRKKEIDRKFDEIVEFSGAEKFLDTPVKRYSSGMRVRLAFAVAAHLEPEVLIIDEVLAVGDATFQRKCLNKMQDVGKAGRTIIFVSHSMPAITRMCERVIMIEGGRLALDGPAPEVVGYYLKGHRENAALREWNEDCPGGDVARLRSVRARTEKGDILDIMDIRRPIGIEIEYDILQPGHVILITFGLWNEEGVNVCFAVDVDPEWRRRPRPPGRYVSTGWIPANFLSEGMINVNTTLWLHEPIRKMEYKVTDAVIFQVVDKMEGDSARGDFVGEIRSATRPLLKWETTAHFND